MSGVTAEEDKKPADGGVHINLKVKGQVWLSPIPIFVPLRRPANPLVFVSIQILSC
jgi:hypothetical protein